MFAYVLRRALWSVPVILVSTFLAFALVKEMPSEPFTDNPKLAPSVRDNLRELYGLDDPYLKQYADFVTDLVQGDFGLSTKPGHREVREVITETLPTSMLLGACAFAFAAFIGIGLGVISALKANGITDYVITFFATMAFALPSFVVATLWVSGKIYLPPPIGTLQFEFPYGWDSWGDRIGPILVLGLSIMPYFTRLVRSSMLEALQQEYITTSRAKGLSWRRTVVRHALRNSMIPTVINAGPLFAFVLTGSFIIERIMIVPGVADLFIDAFDSPVDSRMVLATTVLLSVLIVVLNLIVDMIVAVLDPRIARD
ncbi:MAG: ABC-type transporter, integral rane subunit [Thermoleophilia bacterium]|nr:ABC-type transporter, integral rane subunit [Thermoleophilia bacterium]